MAARGIEVFSFDQRYVVSPSVLLSFDLANFAAHSGWGRTCATKSQRGLTGPNSQILQDIDEVLVPRLTLAESQNVPTFLMGHSNGGGIALWYAIYGTHRDRFAGVVAQSPLVALHPHIKPWFTTVAAGKVAAKFFPNQQLLNKLDPKVMSRDKEVCRKFDEDELCHDTGTLIQIADMLGRAKSLQKEEVYVKYNPDIPLLVAHGSGDMVRIFFPSALPYGEGFG